jgi:ribosomal protein S18 acetylase RimI-like enzyme
MEFELSKELIDQIIFGMENQDQDFFVDAETQQVIGREDIEETDLNSRYFPIPEWASVHGYNLMERFVSSLKNPIYREQLRSILSSGRGVFRQFKNAVKQRSDIERLWFVFKEREMRREVFRWYNALRDVWGLEHIDLEIDNTEELVLSDFTFREWKEEARKETTEVIEDLDRTAFFDMLSDLPPKAVEALYADRRAGEYAPEDKNAFILTALTPEEEWAGFIWAAEEEKSGGLSSTILQLYVFPEYRGLGLAKALLDQYLKASFERDVDCVSVELFGNALFMRDTFSALGFSLFSQTMDLDLQRWHDENTVLP